jgi:kynureninase
MRDPFDALPGAEGWQLSNPPILPMASLRASLEIFTEATMDELRERSLLLTGRMEKLLHTIDYPDLEIFTPTDPTARGCQLSLYIKSGGKALFDFITSRGVIADWREPNVIRVAPVPLYNTMADVESFVELLAEGIEHGA